MDSLIDAFSFLQQSLFEAVVQPLVFAVGQAHLLDKAYEGTGWLVVGLLPNPVAVGRVFAQGGKTQATRLQAHDERLQHGRCPWVLP